MTTKEREDLQAYFDGKFRGIDQRFATIETHLDRQDAAMEKTTTNILLTIEAEGASARRHADWLFSIVDAPLGSALERPQTRDRPKRRGSADRPPK